MWILLHQRLVPAGHPVDVMKNENKELQKVASEINNLLSLIENKSAEQLNETILTLTGLYNQLIDVNKHYQRKEFLVFPFLEKNGITGPPKVMWGKHDEIRELLKGSLEILNTKEITADDLIVSSEIVLQPAVKGVTDMIIKEEQILFPMLMDTLSDAEWLEVQKQSLDIGFCLYDPPIEWQPATMQIMNIEEVQEFDGNIKMPSGSFTTDELLAILNTLPIDMTFVDKDDKVKYFSQSRDRIFHRSRAIINRDVRHCHPPASAHIVDKILEDFKSGKQDRAPFWINMGGKFIHIEYFALRDEKGGYLGTLEVSQDLTGYRALKGEQRILSYE